MKLQSDINQSANNLTVPFFPSASWYVTEFINPATIAPQNIVGPYFSYIQAFFGGGVTDATIAVYSGVNADDGTPIVNPVRFAYSGETKQFKGSILLTTGVDRNGQTVTPETFGDFSQIIAYGGTI
jgi:hypothetical protein